jgi:hypothetical protein
MAHFVIPRRFRAAQLQPVQRRLARQRRTVRSFCRKLADQNRQHRIVPQFVVVIEVFITQRDADNPLQHHRAHFMLHQFWNPRIGEAASKSFGQPDRPSVSPSSSAPASEVIAPPSKAATTWRPSTGANSNTVGLHSVGTGEFLRFAKRLCCRRTFADSEPRCTYLV